MTVSIDYPQYERSFDRKYDGYYSKKIETTIAIYGDSIIRINDRFYPVTLTTTNVWQDKGNLKITYHLEADGGEFTVKELLHGANTNTITYYKHSKK